MATNHFVLGAAILVLGILTESSAHNGRTYPQYAYPNYQQQRSNQPQRGCSNNQGSQLPPGISVSDVEWVCKNANTGDMYIYENSAQKPGGNNGQGQWQQLNYPKTPAYPPNQPTHPQVNPNYPTQSTQNPQQSTQALPSSNGAGLIDIRFGEK